MDLKDKVVVVTGSNGGIGKETAAGLARLGATTVLACRNESKAEAAAGSIPGLDVWTDPERSEPVTDVLAGVMRERFAQCRRDLHRDAGCIVSGAFHGGDFQRMEVQAGHVRCT